MQINPNLPALGAEYNTWGGILNAALEQIVTQGNGSDAQINGRLSTSSLQTLIGDRVMQEVGNVEAGGITDSFLAARIDDLLSLSRAAVDRAIDSAVPYTADAPVYAGARPHSYDAALRLYNGEAAELADIRRLISEATRGDTRCRIVAIGDSRTRGAGLSGSPKPYSRYSWPAQLRDMLGAREGEFYFDPTDDRFSAITGLTFNADEEANFMTTVANEAASITIALSASTGFDLWVFRTGTTELLSISVDGGAAETFAPGSGASWKRFEKRGLANTPHTVTLTVPALSAGLFSFSRIAPYNAATGLTVSNAGRSSSRPMDWDSTTWSSLLPTIIGTNAHVPDVAIIQLGTNWMTSTYANLQSIVTKLRAAGVKVLLQSFGPRLEDLTDPVFNTRRGYQYDLADEFDLPLVDNLQVIGDWTTADARVLFADTVHENQRGLNLEGAATARVLTV